MLLFCCLVWFRSGQSSHMFSVSWTCQSLSGVALRVPSHWVRVRHCSAGRWEETLQCVDVLGDCQAPLWHVVWRYHESWMNIINLQSAISRGNKKWSIKLGIQKFHKLDPCFCVSTISKAPKLSRKKSMGPTTEENRRWGMKHWKWGTSYVCVSLLKWRLSVSEEFQQLLTTC